MPPPPPCHGARAVLQGMDVRYSSRSVKSRLKNDLSLCSDYDDDNRCNVGVSVCYRGNDDGTNGGRNPAYADVMWNIDRQKTERYSNTDDNR